VAYLSVLVLNLCAIGAIPLFVNTTIFPSVVAITRVLSFVPTALPYLLPSSWGSAQNKPHEKYGSYVGLFRTILLFSTALHGKATIVGLAYNAPESHVHRHSIHLPFDIERRSAWERTTNAFGRILGATSDHPVVRKVGWDVLLSGVSLGLWAAVRVTDVLHVMTYQVSQHDQEDNEYGQTHDTGAATSENKPRGAKATLRSALGIDNGSSHQLRSRHRAAKTETDSEDEDSDSDSDYVPTPSEMAAAAEGDVLPSAGDEGWESAALAWGLTALGGLGAGSAAVYGGECIAR
jgi:hypothetical protein